MIVPVVRYAVVCDRCGANSLTDEFDHYDIPTADFRTDVRDIVENLGWINNSDRDLCGTCADETGEEGHDYVGVLSGKWWILPGPVEVHYRDCTNRGCRVTEFSDGSSHRRLPNREVTLVPYTDVDEVMTVRPDPGR
jgi:hypothetical protein